MSEIVVECQEIHREFSGAEKTKVLNGVNLSVGAGDSIAIEGASGSGKSTLLHILAGLDRPSKGKLRLFGKTLDEMGYARLLRVRNQQLGMVYQFHHLLPEFSAIENVSMPLLIGGCQKRYAMEKAMAAIVRVGLHHRSDYRPSQLSGGERQRVAIARAIVIKPRLVLADEPTGNLDKENASVVCDLLLQLCRDEQASVVVATHDKVISEKMKRKLLLNEGKLIPVS